MTTMTEAGPAWRYCLISAALVAGWWAVGGTLMAQPESQDASVAVRPQVTPSPGGTGDTGAEDGVIPTKNLWQIMQDGGPLMYPIAACSFVLLAFTLERAIALRRGRVIPKPFVTRFLQQLRDGELDREQALGLCEGNGSPVAVVLGGAVRRWGRPAVEIEQAIIDAGERVTNGLRRYLRVINAVHVVSPLLGLLGTVTGMIRSFNVIATTEAMGRPDLLASGIAEALLTTAFGLIVAIPALICYLFFVSRVDRLIIEIDALGQEVVNMISAEELQERQALGKSRRPVRKEPAKETAA